MSFNRTILMGNLTRDPETQLMQNGTTVCRGSLAINEKWKDSNGEQQEYTSYIDFTIWGKRGEAFARFLSKGSAVIIEGKLKQDRWADKETGDNRSRVQVSVDNWSFTNASNKTGGGGGNQPSSSGAAGDDVPF